MRPRSDCFDRTSGTPICPYIWYNPWPQNMNMNMDRGAKDTVGQRAWPHMTKWRCMRGLARRPQGRPLAHTRRHLVKGKDKGLSVIPSTSLVYGDDSDHRTIVPSTQLIPPILSILCTHPYMEVLVHPYTDLCTSKQAKKQRAKT